MQLTARFSEALSYAFALHHQQQRKASEVPYFAHLMAVAAIVLDYGADEDTAIAALLHDAIEDQGGAPVRAEIARRFGGRVAAMVEECTDADTIPKPPWRARKEKYLAHLPVASQGAQLISAADKLHNVRTMIADYHRLGETLWDRFSGAKQGTLWYYRAVVTALAPARDRAPVDALEQAVAELERLSRGASKTPA